MLPRHRSRIVATIGPATEAPEVLDALLLAGLDVARLNFSHEDLPRHGERIRALRAASARTGRPLAIMADLPGPKIRLGELAAESVRLQPGDRLVLTSETVLGDAGRMTVHLPGLHARVRPGDAIFVNDGIVRLEVEAVTGTDVRCLVREGGEVRSRKGVNVPGVDLGISAFTAHDRECLAFALAQGADAVSQSFVDGPDDIVAVKQAAEALGHAPFVVAKIERARALDRLDAILDVADGVMVARGDLGVEIPIERIAMTQKDIVRRANQRGRPVIIATQMLESMTTNARPTRAEATDVANAILDGADAVMLSGESAIGRYPVEAVRMLAAIAAQAEPRLAARSAADLMPVADRRGRPGLHDLLALGVEAVAERYAPAALFVPTTSGATARDLARFRPSVWVVALSLHRSTCQALQFSWGVRALHVTEEPHDWRRFVRDWLAEHGLGGTYAIVVEGPSRRNPDAYDRMELIDLR